MALPKIEVPTYPLTIPSSKELIKFRQFLVKEEKILLMALQEENPNAISEATKQIINNCIITPNFDISKLTLYDLEYLFLQLRIHSQGPTIKIHFSPRDKEFTDCKECLKIREVEVDLTKAKVVFNENHTNEIQLEKDLQIRMKYPDITLLSEFEKAKQSEDVNDLFKAIWKCVDIISDSQNVYKASDETVEKGVEWLENLKKSHFQKLEHFFETMPRLEQTIHIKCSKCNYKTTHTLRGLESFFV